MVLDRDSTGRLWTTYESGHGDESVLDGRGPHGRLASGVDFARFETSRRVLKAKLPLVQ